MDALEALEAALKAARSGCSYLRDIRQAYLDGLKPVGDPQSDYYASRLGRAEEGGEALEPQPQCECWWVDEKLWTTHYGAAEPGSQMEWNPDCPAHPPLPIAPDRSPFEVGCDGMCAHDECVCDPFPAAAPTLEPRMECDGPDAAETFDVAGLKVTRASLDELGDSLQRITDAERSVFRSGGQTKQYGPRPRIATTPPVPSSSAGRGVGSPGVSAGAEEPAPSGGWGAAGEVTTADVVRQVLASTIVCGRGHLRIEDARTYDWSEDDWHDWRQAVAAEVSRRIGGGVGATPTPKPAEPQFESGLDMGARIDGASEFFPQHKQPKK